MTRKQTERATDVLNNLVVAIAVGSGGDWVVSGSRVALDCAGLFLAVLCFKVSHQLTGKLGGNRL